MHLFTYFTLIDSLWQVSQISETPSLASVAPNRRLQGSCFKASRLQKILTRLMIVGPSRNPNPYNTAL